MAGTFKRIQDLFRRGEILVLEAAGVRVPVYVAKLNAFEHDEALKDARAARARRAIAYDRDEEQQVQVDALLASMSDADLHEDLLRRKSMELLNKAEEQVRTDRAWKERLEAIDRAALVGDGTASDQERQVMADLIREHGAAIDKAHQKLMREYLADLKATSRYDLDSLYHSAWRESIAATAWYETRRQSEIWYALRECTVDLDDNGVPDESTLVVGDRLCPTRADVNDLPDEVITRVVECLDREMTPQEAGNSDAPSASSGSSGQRNEEADSTPSTPTET